MYSRPIEHTWKHVTPILPNKNGEMPDTPVGLYLVRPMTEIKWTDTRGVMDVNVKAVI